MVNVYFLRSTSRSKSRGEPSETVPVPVRSGYARASRRLLARGSEHYLSGPLYTVRSRSEGPNRRRFVEVGATPASLGLYSLVVAISPVKRDLFSFICALARSPSSSSQRSAGSRRAIWRVFAALIREGICLDHRRLLDLRRAGFGCSFSHI